MTASLFRLLLFPLFFGNVAGPAPTPIPGTLSVHSLTAVADTTVTTGHTSSSFTPLPNTMIVVVTSTLRTGADPGATTTSDTDTRTWVQIVDSHYLSVGTYHGRLAVYASPAGSSPVAMTVTSTYGSATASVIQQIFEVSGSDVANGVLQTFVQHAASNADPPANTQVSRTLSAAGATGNRAMMIATHVAGEGATQKNGWAEVVDTASVTPALGLQVQWRSDIFDTSLRTQWSTSAVYCAIGIELKKGP